MGLAAKMVFGPFPSVGFFRAQVCVQSVSSQLLNRGKFWIELWNAEALSLAGYSILAFLLFHIFCDESDARAICSFSMLSPLFQCSVFLSSSYAPWHIGELPDCRFCRETRKALHAVAETWNPLTEHFWILELRNVPRLK